MFHEIWKWDEAEKRIVFDRAEAGTTDGSMRVAQLVEDLREENARLRGALAGRDVQGELNEQLRQELQIVRRLYESKSIECARLQKELEKRNG